MKEKQTYIEWKKNKKVGEYETPTLEKTVKKIKEIISNLITYELDNVQDFIEVEIDEPYKEEIKYLNKKINQLGDTKWN